MWCEVDVWKKERLICRLSIVKGMIQAGKVRITESAFAGGGALGFNCEGMINVVMTLTLNDFYKSMTTYADHKVWQDVYRPATKALESSI